MRSRNGSSTFKDFMGGIGYVLVSMTILGEIAGFGFDSATNNANPPLFALKSIAGATMGNVSAANLLRSRRWRVLWAIPVTQEMRRRIEVDYHSVGVYQTEPAPHSQLFERVIGTIPRREHDIRNIL